MTSRRFSQTLDRPTWGSFQLITAKPAPTKINEKVEKLKHVNITQSNEPWFIRILRQLAWKPTNRRVRSYCSVFAI